MSSINAEQVALEVMGTIGTGKKPSVRAIAPKHGYSLNTANSGQIQKTKTYKRTVQPLVDQLEEERQAIMERLKVTRDDAKYRDLMDGLDKVTKTHQLLTGGATENLAVQGVEITVRR